MNFIEQMHKLLHFLEEADWKKSAHWDYNVLQWEALLESIWDVAKENLNYQSLLLEILH